MIVNIRGTSGSGKSTLVRLLAEHQGGAVPLVRNGNGDVETWLREPHSQLKAKDIYGYVTKRGAVHIVGPYVSDCGGCDAIKTQDEVCDRVRVLSRNGNSVIFEGLLISHIYGRYRDLALEFGAKRFRFAFLDTPLEVCVERVRARRLRKGNTKPLNIDNTVQKWHDSRRVFQKAVSDGLNPVWLNWEDPLKGLLVLLEGE